MQNTGKREAYTHKVYLISQTINIGCGHTVSD